MTGALLIVLSLCVAGLGVAVFFVARSYSYTFDVLERHEKLLEREKNMTDFLYSLHMKDVYPPSNHVE